MNCRKSVIYFVALVVFGFSSIVAAKVNVIEPTFDSATHKVIQDTTKSMHSAVTRG